jgi:hypothetical protein
MRWLTILLFTQSLWAISNKPWKTYSNDEYRNIKRLIKIISRSSTGKLLIQKAKAKANATGRTMYDIVKMGNTSLTDTTLTRRFSPRNPAAIVYEQKSVIYLDGDLDTYDAVLDLTHELTHFTFRKDFNPYKRNFSLQAFIKSTIEGQGGEVEAYMMECTVMQELFSSKVSKRYQCNEIIDPHTGLVSKKLAINKFYRVGNYYKRFAKVLKKQDFIKEFPKLDDKTSVFLSSAYGLPYPLAAYHEYISVVSRACENDEKRLSYLRPSGRSPASENNTYLVLKRDYDKRCRKLPLELGFLL